MRSKKAALNTILSLLEEVVGAVCGFIIPKLILSGFGSRYNGLIASITQFLGLSIILRSGIGGTTRAALYKPLATHDKAKIDGIIKATDLFMKKVGFILVIAIVIAASIYPLFVRTEFKWFFTFSLFLIIGASTFAESFFGITYLIVLQADQNLWIASIMRIVCCILNAIITFVLVAYGASIHVVKAGSALVYVLYPITLNLYVKRHYLIDTNVEPDNEAIMQRWDAFWQQVSAFVMNNTDVMVLTVFSNLTEVSVYSVYNMIVGKLKQGINAFTNGLEAAFGDMIAKSEKEHLTESVSVVETIVFSVSTVIYSCASVLIFDFIELYTFGIVDADYIRPVFAYIIIIVHFFLSARLPYQLVVQAAGHYRQTKKGAIFESVLNIILSVILVFSYGLVGVALGSLVATIFRTVQYSHYASRYILTRSEYKAYGKIVLSLIEALLIIFIFKSAGLPDPKNYLQWFENAVFVGVLSVIIVSLMNLIFNTRDSVLVINKIKCLLKK